MGAKLKAVRTELILLGLTAVFLGGLLAVSYRDRTTATVTVTAEQVAGVRTPQDFTDLVAAALERRSEAA